MGGKRGSTGHGASGNETEHVIQHQQPGYTPSYTGPGMPGVSPTVPSTTGTPQTFVSPEIDLDLRLDALKPTIQEDPGLAADLLLGSIPNTVLPYVSRIITDADRYVSQQTTAGGIPAAFRTYYEQVLQMPDSEFKKNALAVLDGLRDATPEEQQRAVSLLERGGFPELVKSIDQATGELTDEAVASLVPALAEGIPQSQGTGFADVPGAIAGAFALPFKWGGDVLSALTSLAATPLPDAAEERVDEARGVVGDVVAGAEKAAGMLGRGVAAVPAALPTGGHLIATYLTPGSSENDETWDKFYNEQIRPIWHLEDHSPITYAFADAMDTEVDDLPDWFISASDIGGDFYGQALLFRGATEVRAARRVPLETGRIASETTLGHVMPRTVPLSPIANALQRSFVDWSKSWTGRRTLRDVNTSVETWAKAGDSVEIISGKLRDRFKWMPQSLSDNLARATTTAERNRAFERAVVEPVVPKEQVATLETQRKAAEKARQEQEAIIAEQQKAIEDYNAQVEAAKAYKAEIEAGIEAKPVVSKVGNRWEIEGDPGRALYKTKKEAVAAAEAMGPRAIERPVPALKGKATRAMNRAQQAIDAADAEIISIDTQLGAMLNREPVWIYPKVSHVSAILHEAPVTLTERIFTWLYTERVAKVPFLDIRRIANDLTSRNLLINQHANNVPHDWATRNAEVLRKTFELVKTPARMRQQLIGEMMQLKNRQEWFEWRMRVNEAIRAGVERNGKLPPEMAEAVRAWTKTADEVLGMPLSETVTRADGTPAFYEGNVLEDAAGRPMPSLPNEFAGHSFLPPIDILRDAASTVKMWDKRMLTAHPKSWGVARAAVWIPHFVVLRLPTIILKPVLLATRGVFGVGPMSIKIQIDQALREVGMGLGSPLRRTGEKAVTHLPGGIKLEGPVEQYFPDSPITGKPDITAVGAVASELDEINAVIIYPQKTIGIDWGADAKTRAYVAKGIRDQLVHLNADELARMVAQRGAEATLRYMEAHPESSLATKYRETVGTIVEKNGMAPLDYLKRVEEHINQFTMGDDALRGYVARGKWETEGPKPGRARAIDKIRAEIDEAYYGLRKARAEGDARTEATILKRIDDLEDQLGRTYPDVQNTLHGDDNAFLRTVEDRLVDGTYVPPRVVRVARRAHPGLGAKGFYDVMNGWSARVNNALYRHGGLPKMSRVDLRGTRGTTYRNYVERIYRGMYREGMDPQAVLEIAKQRAALLTSDLHYDISARSSLDRTMRDVFWFLPAVREQLTTWLVKIPGQAYPVLGQALLIGQAHTLLEGLKDFGILVDRQTPDGETRTEVTIPGLEGFASGIVGSDLDLSFDPDGINPVTPGGSKMWPQLSNPALEQLIDESTHNWLPDGRLRNTLRMLTTYLSFDEGAMGARYTPGLIQRALEVVGINLPTDMFSASAWSQAQRRGDIMALQAAQAELADEGVMPPGVGASEKEVQNWIEEIQSRAQEYRLGSGVIRVLLSTFSPLSNSTTPKAATEFYKWRTANGMDFDTTVDPETGEPIGWTDEDYKAFRKYGQEHPEAWPYLPGVSPYFNTGYDDPTVPADAPIADKLAAGEMDIREPAVYNDQGELTGGYLMHVLAINGWRAEETQFRRELKAAGIKSASDLLGPKRDVVNRITAAHVDRLQRWFFANPHVEQYLDDLFSKNEDDRLSFKQETALDALRSLNVLEDMGVFDATGGFVMKDVGAVKAQLYDITSAVFDGQEADNKTEEVVNYYHETIVDPWREKTNSLYAKASGLFAAGLDSQAFDVLDEIRTFNNSFSETTYRGETLPSPQEYIWNGWSQKKKETKMADWAATSPAYLSEFQLSKLGLPDFEGRDVLISQISQLEDARFLETHDQFGNYDVYGDAADAINRRYDTALFTVAKEFGTAGAQVVALHLSPPAVRIMETGIAGTENPDLGALVSGSTAIVRWARANGFSEKGAAATMVHGQNVMNQKLLLYSQVEMARANSREVDRFFNRMAVALAPYNEEVLLGVPLYERFFFGTNPDFVDPELVQRIQALHQELT